MKYLFIVILILTSCKSDYHNHYDIDKKVNELLSEMTLEEKVGQMAQINLTVVAKGPSKWKSTFPLEVDPKRVKRAIVQYNIGSVLNTINTTAQTKEIWYKTIRYTKVCN